MSHVYDVVFIGGGPAAYPAAIRAAQLGMKAACIERQSRLGGTCLNVGCIPSKSLLESSERYVQAKFEFAKHGIEIPQVSINLEKLLGHKDQVVADLGKGIDVLFRKHKIARFVGHGRITSPNSVVVKEEGRQEETLTANAIVIATGSNSIALPNVSVDEKQIVSSTGALSFPSVPRHLVVIGGGYIGLELGSVWQRLGAEVTVIEYLDRITPGLDSEMAAQLHKVLERAGFRFRFRTKVTSARYAGDGIVLSVEPATGGPQETVTADAVLVAVGRSPYTDGLGLEEVGVERDAKGFIKVDQRFATNISGIYAIGDVIGGAMLAHKASEEGVVLIELLAGQHPHLNYSAIPSIIYTWPEVAAVGATEEQLKQEGIDYRVGRFPFSANSRARAKADTTGLVKILADARTDRVLGAHIIGPDAGTMIHELSLAMEFSASSEDIALACHAHPTLPEAVKEAALAVAGRPLHI